MKFVCDNCKAKYQIGDDKVAGKTLRMKCRRCGHMIQVAATVTESSVSDAFPKEVTGSAAAPVPPGAARPPPPPRPSFESPDTNSDDADGATVVRPSPFLMAEAARAMKERGSVPQPPGSIASRGSVPRIVPPARPSMRSAPPPAGSAVGPAAAGGASTGGALEPAGTHTVSSPGLYNGFAQAVASIPAPAASSAQLPTEDWYVGIGGVPLGPVRLSVIRDKAAAGQVDRDSLVWREGFDEWQPVRANAALLALVDEAKAIRMSRTGMPAVTGGPGMGTPGPFGVTPGPRPGISAAPLAAPSNVAFNAIPDAAPSLPFDLVRSSSIPTGPATPNAPLIMGDPFAPNGTSTPGLAGGIAAGGAGVAGPNGAFGAAPTNGYGLSTTQGTAFSKPESSMAAPISVPPPSLKKKKGLHPMAWAFIAMAATFGGVAAWALLFRDGKTEIRYVEKNGTAGSPQLGAAPPAPPTGEPTAGAQTSSSPATSSSPSSGSGGGVARNPGTTATVKGGDTAAPIDTSGFGSPVGGPNATGTSDNGGKGGELSEGEINGVVSRGKPGITRRCWTPAYDARPSDAPKSAKVNVTVKVGPSGSVSSATASGGGAAYPSLASCVQNSVKAWQFPPSDSGATVAIPFSFSGQ